MTAKIEPTQTADGIAYRVSRVFPNWASAQAGASALTNINPVAFTPALQEGEPFDPPEAMPPNCDGHNPIGHAYAGEALAQAQHEAAVDGDDCDGAACLLTRGAND